MTALARDDIQGFVLRGYRMPVAAYLFYRFDRAAGARAWLLAMIDPVTTAAEWDSTPAWCANVALTYPGLAALGLPADQLAGFPEDFRVGMAARSAAQLGDPDHDWPDRWEPEPPFATRGVHAMLMVWADNQPELDGRLVEFARRAAAAGGITLVGAQPAAALGGGDREHFGFRDGISQPMIVGNGPVDGGTDGEPPIAAGEFLLGQPDELGHTPTLVPAVLSDNGTFAVYRKLRQDVAGFRDFLGAEHDAAEAEHLAAKLMGRWRSGAPLALAAAVDDPDLAADPLRSNAFDYLMDPVGYHCPRGAHVRRARPRDGSSTNRRRRLVRRGMTYGPALPDGAPDDGADRGLIGVFLNASIERQYEFVQRRWLNWASFDGLSDETDPITGSPGRDFTWQRRPIPRRRTDLPRFVSVRGGEYFFVPGMTGLQFLGEGGRA